MTYEEFRQQYDTYDWDTYQPLAVILNTGNRAYIDMPEQAALSQKELIITRRTNPRRPEHYSYTDIARVVPLMELPADPGGMSYAEFDPLIRQLLMAEPFEPFVVELTNGEKHEINRRAEIGRAGRFVKFYKGNLHTYITYDQVAKLTQLPKSVPA